MNYKTFKKIERTDFRGENWPQWIAFFPNGYGVSIVKHKHSYELELALLKWDFDEYWKITWELTYDDGNFMDVCGWLNDKKVNALCRKIAQKPGRF